jgi:hypothetical protein
VSVQVDSGLCNHYNAALATLFLRGGWTPLSILVV